MSFLGGLISSAAKGLQGGAEAVSTIAKAGVEKNMQIDLQKELADIEFKKQKQLETFKADRAIQDKTNTKVRDFDIETKKKEANIVGPKDQSIIDANKSAQKANEQKYATEKLATEVAQTRFSDMKKLYEAYEKNDTKAIEALTKKLTLEDNLIGSASRNKRAEIFMKMGQAIEDILSNRTITDPDKVQTLTQEMQDNFKKARDLIGNTGAFSSMNNQSGGNTTTTNNNGLVNSQLPNSNSFNPKDVTEENAEQFIGKQFKNPETNEVEVMVGFDKDARKIIMVPAAEYDPKKNQSNSNNNQSTIVDPENLNAELSEAEKLRNQRFEEGKENLKAKRRRRNPETGVMEVR